MSSPLLDEDLRQILVLRWQLCEADLPAGGDLPYSAAWARAQLLYQVLTEFYTETEAGRIVGLQAPGEVAGLAARRAAAREHFAAISLNMIAESQPASSQALAGVTLSPPAGAWLPPGARCPE